MLHKKSQKNFFKVPHANVMTIKRQITKLQNKRKVFILTHDIFNRNKNMCALKITNDHKFLKAANEINCQNLRVVRHQTS